ncbi:zf-HC2 domain-containing protein [Lapillicoccus sp.]|uniref:zf-HC2 domain-containing protein n=1 Tax=Lapillicoccus sp. TaxID=1909287 RepID=UPI003983D9C6
MSGWDDVDFGGITCREFVELVTDYLEDLLDARSRARFEQHVAGCPGCSRYLDQIRDSTRVLGRVTLDSLSPAARGQLMDAFRSWRSGRSDEPGPD